MKVKELISLLKEQDPEMRVVVNGYESGFDEVEKLELVPIVLNSDKQDKVWEGEFLESLIDDADEFALLFPRKS